VPKLTPGTALPSKKLSFSTALFAASAAAADAGAGEAQEEDEEEDGADDETEAEDADGAYGEGEGSEAEAGEELDEAEGSVLDGEAAIAATTARAPAAAAAPAPAAAPTAPTMRAAPTSEAVNVFARIRPLSSAEVASGAPGTITVVSDTTLELRAPEVCHKTGRVVDWTGLEGRWKGQG
jgi:hypothetical protein